MHASTVRAHGAIRGDEPQSPNRQALTTADPRQARDIVDAAYGWRLRIKGPAGPGWSLSVDRMTAGGITVADATFPGDLDFQISGRDELVVVTVLAGSVECDSGRFERFDPGDVYIGNHPEFDGILRTHGLRAHTVSIPSPLLMETSAAHGHAPVRPCESGRVGAHAGGSRQWRRLMGLVDALMADGELAEHSLVIGTVGRLVAATALAVFLGPAPSAPRVDRHDGSMDTVRRACAFMEAQPDRDIRLGDIADAANVTPRAVQMAFRRQLDTTPLAYLRKVRLHRARLQLLNASRGDGVTVADVGLRWGFANQSRFAAYYREAYGEAPSRTLRV